MNEEIDALTLYIMLHLKYAGIDYAKMMSKLSGVAIEKINNRIKEMEEMGLIERDSGSAVKRSEARFKKSNEVHKHHTYYKLTKEGKKILKSVKREEIDTAMKDVDINSKFYRHLKYFIEKAYQ
ncbi:MAG: DUF2250 domain-containing protein [Thermoplasmata archaeon]|nr:DUF2250 domain-containing protein [Thermoplasmata archaeon]